jgi:protein-disulfide isomerase
MEQVVRELLKREPEIVYQALQELQRKGQVAALDRQRRIIAERRDELMYDPEAPVLGDPQGSATVVEFFDYRCGFCRRMLPTIQALLEEDQDLRLVLKELPVLGPESLLASRAALASRAQGLYTPFHFALLQADEITEASVFRIAADIGVDVERLRRDMESPQIAATIEHNTKLARALGIEGTPAFVIGDALVPGAIDRTGLEALIDSARRSG